jgi:hypothetical protein
VLEECHEEDVSRKEVRAEQSYDENEETLFQQLGIAGLL